MKNYYNIHSIWIALLLLTIFTYSVGTLGFSGLVVVSILLLTSVIKSVFIIRDFMELKGVSLLWRALMYGWLWSVILTIAVTYVISL
jgi:hypothetical protein